MRCDNLRRNLTHFNFLSLLREICLRQSFSTIFRYSLSAHGMCSQKSLKLVLLYYKHQFYVVSSGKQKKKEKKRMNTEHNFST